MKRHRGWIWLLAVLLSAPMPAGSKLRLRPPLWIDNDQSPIAEPKERKVSETYDILYNSWLRHLSVEYKASLYADPGALNVNAWDEIPNSSWFTNRIGLKTLSYAEITSGIPGEDPKPGAWSVLSIGDEGYTPKLDIRDPDGRRYILKFDLPTALERNSAAERICTSIMHAAGYNVPHNSIVYFRRENLVLDPKAKYTNAIGKKEPLTPSVFEALLAKLKSLPDGRYRSLASLRLSGKPVGQFLYSGKREDDPNDLIPHELRRELRGLRMICAWINNADAVDKNALDMYIAGQDGRGYVKHYLLDFGSTLGSGDFIYGPYRVGHEYIFDGDAMGMSLITFGAWQRPWDAKGRILYPEIGYFQPELFEPARWKPNYANLAFVRMDDADGYWGAKIVTAFTDEAIQRLVQLGEYTRPEATPYLSDVLKKRRDIIGRYWFGRITPLEEFSLSPDGPDYRLSFRDLALERGYAPSAGLSYQFWVEGSDGRKLAARQFSQPSQQYLKLSGELLSKAGRPDLKPDRYGRIPAARIVIQTCLPGGKPALPVEVILGYAGDRKRLEALGWHHAPHD